MQNERCQVQLLKTRCKQGSTSHTNRVKIQTETHSRWRYVKNGPKPNSECSYSVCQHCGHHGRRTLDLTVREGTSKGSTSITRRGWNHRDASNNMRDHDARFISRNSVACTCRRSSSKPVDTILHRFLFSRFLCSTAKSLTLASGHLSDGSSLLVSASHNKSAFSFHLPNGSLLP